MSKKQTKGQGRGFGANLQHPNKSKFEADSRDACTYNDCGNFVVRDDSHLVSKTATLPQKNTHKPVGEDIILPR